MKIGVAIVEDDKEMREVLVKLIDNNEDMLYLGSFSSAEKFMADFNSINADVVVMDIHLPGNSGIDAVKKMKPKRPDTQYLMFTVFEDDDKIFDSLCAGATGYLLKNTPSPRIIESIKELYAGGSPMSSQIARKVIQSFNSKPGALNLPDNFTSREVEILDHLSKGYRYKEIAGILYISTETVRTHIRNIYQKLHVQSRTDALNKVYTRR